MGNRSKNTRSHKVLNSRMFYILFYDLLSDILTNLIIRSRNFRLLTQSHFFITFFISFRLWFSKITLNCGCVFSIDPKIQPFSNNLSRNKYLMVFPSKDFLYFCQQQTDTVMLNGKMSNILPYKHTTWIPRRNDVETVVSTAFQHGIHMVCL